MERIDNELRAFWRVACFGFSCGAASGVGQTFFVALFVPGFLERCLIDKATFGTLYGGATIASALVFPFSGPLVDRIPLKRFLFGVLAALSLGIVVTSVAHSAVTLFAGLFFLRHAGQGLMGHMGSTAIARRFTSMRGRALGIYGLGFPFAESLLPLVVVASLAAFDESATLLVVAGSFILVLSALLTWTSRDVPAPTAAPATKKESLLSSLGAFRDRDLLALVPIWTTGPFLLTAIFLYQRPIAEALGASDDAFAVSFWVFAICRGASSFLAGPLVDRFSARRLLLLFLIPSIAAYPLLVYLPAGMAIAIFLAVVGLVEGALSTTKTALLADLFGVERFATLRSPLMSLTVLSTAASPALVGALLDADVDIASMIMAAPALIIFAGLCALRVVFRRR